MLAFLDSVILCTYERAVGLNLITPPFQANKSVLISFQSKGYLHYYAVDRQHAGGNSPESGVYRLSSHGSQMLCGMKVLPGDTGSSLQRYREASWLDSQS